MAEPGNVVLRLRHEYRNRVVVELALLLQQHPAITIDGHDWHEIERLPEWCIAESAVRLRLTQIAGTLFLGPVFRQCISGAWLRELRELVGNREFEAIMQTTLPQTQFTVWSETDSLSAIVERCGAAVLLSTIGCDALRQLYATCFSLPVGKLPQSVAMYLYRTAELIRRPESDLVDSSGENTAAEAS